MPIIFGAAASSAALIRLVCPRCGEAQARARRPAGARYACRACHHGFVPPDDARRYAGRAPKYPR